MHLTSKSCVTKRAYGKAITLAKPPAAPAESTSCFGTTRNGATAVDRPTRRTHLIGSAAIARQVGQS